MLDLPVPSLANDERPLCKCHDLPMYREGAHRWQCAVTTRERNRRYREKNNELILEKQRNHREANRDKYREERRLYYEENREKERENGRLYYEKNHDKELERMRKYREEKYEAGLCASCGKEPVLSETYCWGCLNKKGVLGCRESQITQAETQVTQLVAL